MTMISEKPEAVRTAPAGNPATNGEYAAERSAAAACAILKSARPELGGFCEEFLSGAPPEDVARYEAASLAALVQTVFERSSVRERGTTLVELFSLNAEQGERT